MNSPDDQDPVSRRSSLAPEFDGAFLVERTRRAQETQGAGLRVMIVLSLAGLMALAFVPLFFAVASLARATLQGGREQAAIAFARSASAHVRDVRGGANFHRALEAHVNRDGIQAICVYGPKGTREACAGDVTVLPESIPAKHPYESHVAPLLEGNVRLLEVRVPLDDAAVVTRVRTDLDAGLAAPLVGLVGIYMATFALALLTFAYFALTRLIVGPIDDLARAADRVASGARSFQTPRTGAREIAALGASVKQMTAHLVAEEQALRAKINELTLTTRRLGETRAQLVRSERLASVGRLAAGIAHEIGNPIAALMGMEDLLLDGDLPEETQRDFVERMKRETTRIHTVLRDLLDFARPEGAPSGVGDGPPQPAAVSQVYADVIQLLRPQKGFKAITLAADVQTPNLRVAIGADRLVQIMLNLSMNAGDAIATHRASGTITLRARADGDHAVLEVEDDGPGVPAALRARVFEPFVTTKEVGQGTGLGLAVCRGLIESAGGVIGLDAGYEAGARFVVRLPRVH